MRSAWKAVGVALCLALAACGSSNGGGDSDEDIKIGVINGDTGTYAFAGVVAHRAMNIAVEKINSDGGIDGRNLDLDFQDDGSQTSQSLTLLGKYAADREVVAVLGPTATPISIALGPVANSRKIPLLAATVISGAALESGPWTFKTAANPDSIMQDLAQVAATDLKLERVAVVFGRDNDGQVEQKDAFVDGLKKHGSKVAASVSVLNTDTNFGSAAQKVVASKPDAVYVSLTGDASGNMVDQLRGAGLGKDVQILGTSQSVSPQYLDIGGDAVEGTIAGADYDPSLDTEENRFFSKEYEERHDQLPDAYAALGYQSVMQLADALRNIEGEITRDSVRQALTKQREMPGVLGEGEYAIGPDRVPEYGVALLQVRNGKYVTYE